MITVEELKKHGVDTDAGLSRCMNNQDFYLRLVNMSLDDNTVDSLGAALAEGDLDKAFAEVHKLKGASGNLSLTPIYEPALELTELLRHKTPGDYDGLYEKIKENFTALQALREE
jgi:HPt (histidine-containing phosphotransfer) domain-containing protein